jgi:hypothetical protein
MDQTCAIFLALAAAVLVLPQVTRIQLPGGTVIEKIAAQQSVLKEKVEVADKKLEEQLELIKKLQERSISDGTFRHLAGLSLLREYKYWQNAKVGDLFKREFYFLKNRGFIGPETFEFGDWLNDTNLVGKVEPTEIARIYVRLRKDDVPKEWLSTDPEKRKNLRVDIARKLELDLPPTG